MAPVTRGLGLSPLLDPGLALRLARGLGLAAARALVGLRLPRVELGLRSESELSEFFFVARRLGILKLDAQKNWRFIGFSETISFPFSPFQFPLPFQPFRPF